MLSPRLTNCPECSNIPKLLREIDCKIAEISISLYNNISYLLNNHIPTVALWDLLNYRRILNYKYCNPDYACGYTVNMIASKVKLFTTGCKSKCNESLPCEETKYCVSTTTTTSSTSTTTTTTTCSLPHSFSNTVVASEDHPDLRYILLEDACRAMECYNAGPEFCPIIVELGYAKESSTYEIGDQIYVNIDSCDPWGSDPGFYVTDPTKTGGVGVYIVMEVDENGVIIDLPTCI